jgi:hypothetical protein
MQERAQWGAGYKNWRSQNRLPDTPENRERFNTERGYPKGSSSAAPAKPAPGQAGAAPGTTRGPDPAGGAGTGMLNAIRARQGLPPLPPGSRIGAPRFGGYFNEGAAEAAANIGRSFPRTDWQQFTSNARPSTNVEDTRSGLATNAINPNRGPQGPEADWDPSSEELQRQVATRFNPNDPMTRQLMGSDRARMRSDILKSLTPDEFMQWLSQMQQQGNRLLKDRWQ